jgi:hypothetical protein
MNKHEPPSASLLHASLEASVFLRIPEIKKLGHDEWWRRLQENREEWLHQICEKGDVLQYGGGKKGEAAAAFNALAAALAHLAFVPGGVKFDGRRYVATFDGE